MKWDRVHPGNTMPEEIDASIRARLRLHDLPDARRCVPQGYTAKQRLHKPPLRLPLLQKLLFRSVPLWRLLSSRSLLSFPA